MSMSFNHHYHLSFSLVLLVGVGHLEASCAYIILHLSVEPECQLSSLHLTHDTFLEVIAQPRNKLLVIHP